MFLRVLREWRFYFRFVVFRASPKSLHNPEYLFQESKLLDQKRNKYCFHVWKLVKSAIYNSNIFYQSFISLSFNNVNFFDIAFCCVTILFKFFIFVLLDKFTCKNKLLV